MRNILLVLASAALAVVAQKPDLDVKGTFGDANPFSKVSHLYRAGASCH